jgi:hypothetical protein
VRQLDSLPTAQEYAAKLAAKHSMFYAVVVAEAASFQMTIHPLPAWSPEVTTLYTQCVEEHGRALVQLQGMKAAAVPILTEMHSMLRVLAEREVAVNVAVLAGCIGRDRANLAL